MRLLKTLRLLAPVSALALALTACGGDGGDTAADTTETDGGTETPTGAAELDLVSEGTLTVCSDVPYAPFEFEDPASGEYTGFDIELMQGVADQLGLELEVRAIGFDPIQSGTALNSGQCDVAASAITILPEREENLDFSEPYYDANQSLLVPTDSDITGIEDLSGRTVGVQSATTGEQYANENAPDDATIQSFENPGDLFTAMQAGQVDAILQDLPVNAEHARTNDDVEVIAEFETGEQYGFAMRKGNTELTQAVNDALATMREDGTYDELYDKYFATE